MQTFPQSSPEIFSLRGERDALVNSLNFSESFFCLCLLRLFAFAVYFSASRDHARTFSLSFFWDVESTARSTSTKDLNNSKQIIFRNIRKLITSKGAVRVVNLITYYDQIKRGNRFRLAKKIVSRIKTRLTKKLWSAGSCSSICFVLARKIMWTELILISELQEKVKKRKKTPSCAIES